MDFKQTLFISDLHLDPNRPDITQAFAKLLRGCLRGIDAIYILGDLFEVWVDDRSSFDKHIQQLLSTVTQSGVPIYFQHGNRDFLINKAFAKKTGCVLLPEEAKISLYGESVLLLHGDTLCTLDVNYMKSRRILRHPLTRIAFKLSPLSLRKFVARYLRQKSQNHMKALLPEYMDVTQEAVRLVMAKHQVRTLIHGHTHQPGFHTWLNSKHAYMQRIVLGSWHKRASVLCWNQQGDKKLEGFGL